MADAPTANSPAGNAFLAYAKTVKSCAVSLTEAGAEPSPAFQRFVETVTCQVAECFCSSGKRIILPGAVIANVRQCIHTNLSDPCVREERKKDLTNVASGEEDIVNLYLSEFCRRLCSPIAGYIVSLMRDASDDPHLTQVKQYSADDFSKLFDQQSLHYISGYSLKAILKKARQYENSRRWSNFKVVILNRLARLGTAWPDPKSSAYWTALLSRK